MVAKSLPIIMDVLLAPVDNNASRLPLSLSPALRSEAVLEEQMHQYKISIIGTSILKYKELVLNPIPFEP